METCQCGLAVLDQNLPVKCFCELGDFIKGQNEFDQLFGAVAQGC